ncbi:MAG TPA: glycosyltransferase [Thermoanaerobaculia bacterium]|nr:glycosyltransferase [Thermoanaerobaculia bacterium]
MTRSLDAYAKIVGEVFIEHLERLARPLSGSRVLHVNSTRTGGGVAEILHRLIPLQRELGIDARWEVMTGDPDFFQATKGFHNALQGDRVEVPQRLLDHYLEVNRANAGRLASELAAADFVFVHDPQPAALLRFTPGRKGQWIWRCHIDASRPFRPVWKFLRDEVRGYDASVFSLAAFARALEHPQYLIAPSIDPLAEKNIDLPEREVAEVAAGFGIDPDRPMVLQVSRFDRFKDPLGVIRAWQMVRAHQPVQLVLAGSDASDDPEGAAVLAEVRAAVEGEADVHILLLPADAHRTINALQRRADVVLQKSIREGFGLTVTEALWKRRPVVGGDTGGITLQVVPRHTGFLVNTAEGAALRVRYLLRNPEQAAIMGEKGHRHVRENFLLTRHLREYLTVMIGLGHGGAERVEVGPA